MLLKIDTYENIIPELLKAFAEPGAGVMESMPDLRRVLEAHLRPGERLTDRRIERCKRRRELNRYVRILKRK